MDEVEAEAYQGSPWIGEMTSADVRAPWHVGHVEQRPSGLKLLSARERRQRQPRLTIRRLQEIALLLRKLGSTEHDNLTDDGAP